MREHKHAISSTAILRSSELVWPGWGWGSTAISTSARPVPEKWQTIAGSWAGTLISLSSYQLISLFSSAQLSASQTRDATRQTPFSQQEAVIENITGRYLMKFGNRMSACLPNRRGGKQIVSY
jgi:ABC-type phosphate/phosphonate transport system permease subunit